MTGNINDPQFGNLPQAGQARQRKMIADIEKTLAVTPLRNFTGESIGKLADNVSKTIGWLRSSKANTQNFSGGKEAVETYLLNAIIKLNTAVVEYDRRGKSEKFFKDIQAGRVELFNALQYW